MKKVYISSPYTQGDTAVNVKFQIDIADELIELGVPSFCAVVFSLSTYGASSTL